MKTFLLVVIAALLLFSPIHALALSIYEIDAFSQVSIPKPVVDTRTYPPTLSQEGIPVSAHYGATKVDGPIQRHVLSGESMHIGLLVVNDSVGRDVVIDTTDGVSVQIVTKWLQAGASVETNVTNSFLTYELLLDDDRSVSLIDSWTLEGGKWWYHPPSFPLPNTRGAVTHIPTGGTVRLLVAVESEHVEGFRVDQVVMRDASTQAIIDLVDIHTMVSPVSVDRETLDAYDLWIFSMMAIDPNVGKPNALINGQAQSGNAAYQLSLFQKHAQNIKAQGFNGVVVLDWRMPYVDDALGVLRDTGFNQAIIYGKSLIDTVDGIINQRVMDSFAQAGFQGTYFGYDEVGGNARLNDQIAVNQAVNGLGGHSFNTIYWNDRAAVIAASSEPGKEFSHLAYSLGSNGATDLFASLPLAKEPFRQLAYWHPHVENPVRNRVFMGFWLWASGLDGVAPHLYTSLPHIAAIDPANRQGISPYNDLKTWIPPSTLRQHATIYPHQDGFVNTLEWVAIREGVTDLAMVTQLQRLVEATPNMKAEALLNEIREDVLTINSSYVSPTRANQLTELVNEWRAKIRKQIVAMQASAAPAAPLGYCMCQ